MANIKITDLSAIADPISTDVLPIVDVSADTTNKISIEDLLKNAAAGTGAAPAFAFDADPDTGMYRSGANALAFSTGGTGRLFIASDGKIGIGAASARGVHIANSSTAELHLTNNTIGNTASDGSTIYVANTGELGIRNRENSFTTFYTNNTEQMRIDSSGNVGIGTSSPTRQLQVSAATAQIALRSSDSTLCEYLFGDVADDNVGRIRYEHATNNLNFWTNAGERLRINSLGYVGIGTTSPNYQLHCTQDFAVGASGFNQQLKLSNDTIQSLLLGTGYTALKLNPLGGNVGVGTSSPTNGALVVEKVGFQLSLETGTSGDGRLNIGHFNDGAFIGTYGDDGGAADFIRFGTHSGDERMRINSSGNVGIGTTNPVADFVVSNGGADGIELQPNIVANTNRITNYDRNGGSYSNFRLDAAQQEFLISGTERVRIDSSGNVGIGTSSPAHALHIAGATTPELIVQDTTANVKAVVGADNTVGRIGTDSNHGLTLRTNDTERVRISTAGNVGIGTTSPSSSLHIRQTSGAAVMQLQSQDGVQASVVFGDASDVSRGRILYSNNNEALQFEVNNLQEAMRIDSSGRVGIGTTSPSQLLHVAGASAQALVAASSGTGKIRLTRGTTAFEAYASTSACYVGTTSNTDFQLRANGAEHARIDTSGRLLVGTSSSSSNNSVVIEGYSGSNTGQGILTLAKGSSTPADGNVLGAIEFTDSGHVASASVIGRRDGGTWTSGSSQPSRLVFSTTADGASSPTERMRINQQGSVRIGGTGDPGAIHIIDKPGVAIGTQVLTIQGSDESVRVYNASSYANPNGAAMVMWVRANNTTSRSINAAGTINASGADYAEYMTKAGNFALAKGDVCGIDANGLLTNIYTNSVSFVVKSTNPSYVGGDTWGCGFDADSLELEAERQKVDRVAFAGQVPVNVTSAAPGQYIVPFVTEDGGITGIAKDEADLTLAEYMRAVGKVIAIEDDGRARIIVKVA